MFDNRKIKHLRRLPEGDSIVLIWVMLLTMAGRCNSNGMIFLTENIPYTPKMLADELDFEENTVTLALKALEEFNMIVTDGRFFSIAGWEQYQNIEGMEKIREQNRLRQAKYKQKQKLLQGNVTDNVIVTEGNGTDIDIEEEKDSELDNKKNNKKEIRHKYGEYENVLLSDSDFEKLKSEFPSDYTARIENLSSYIASTGKSYKNHLATIRNWARKENTGKENKPRYGSFDVNDAFKKALNRTYTEPEMHKSENSKTAADDENVKKRMEALKAELGQGADQ
jgi:predicted phage replisome organizer